MSDVPGIVHHRIICTMPVSTRKGHPITHERGSWEGTQKIIHQWFHWMANNCSMIYNSHQICKNLESWSKNGIFRDTLPPGFMIDKCLNQSCTWAAWPRALFCALPRPLLGGWWRATLLPATLDASGRSSPSTRRGFRRRRRIRIRRLGWKIIINSSFIEKFNVVKIVLFILTCYVTK